MDLVGIVHQTHGDSICYAADAITPVQLLQSLTVEDTVALVLGTPSIRSIDFLTFVASQPRINFGHLTWTEILTMLDDMLLQQYATAVVFPAYQRTATGSRRFEPINIPISQLKIISVENSNGVGVDYGSYKAPFTRNMRAIKWALSDLIFKTDAIAQSFNAHNTLPSVNGVVCYPMAWTNELFALNGAEFIRTTGSDNKNLVLMDVSPFGELETHRLSSCVNLSDAFTGKVTVPASTNGERSGMKSAESVEASALSEYHFKIELPSTASAGIAIPVIAGRMILPHDGQTRYYTVGGRRYLEFTLTRQMLRQMLLANAQKLHKQLIVKSTVEYNLDQFLISLFHDHGTNYYYLNDNTGSPVKYEFPDPCIAFIAIIKTTKKVVFNPMRPYLNINQDKLLFRPYAGGLLRNARTKEIVDYTRIFYNTSTMVTIDNRKPLECVDGIAPETNDSSIIGIRMQNQVCVDDWNTVDTNINLRDPMMHELVGIYEVAL